MNKILTLLLTLGFSSIAVPALAQSEVEEPNVVVVEEEETAEESTPATPAKVDIVPTEGMNRSFTQQMSGWWAKEYLRLDPNAKVGSPATATPDVVAARLRRLPHLIEMPYNHIVQAYIDQYTQRLRESVSFWLGAQNFYNPIFEEALEAEGLPLELKYLPIVESALDPNAVSRGGNAGLWQLGLTTAKRLELNVNSLVDERRDPLLSTQAAARYLKQLYRQYNDWTLALAAFSSGSNNLDKAIRRNGGDRDFWKLYPLLPRDTRGYVPAFIAANYVMNYYCDHNISPMVASQPLETDTVMIQRDLHLQQVADLCQVNYEMLEALNPQYRTGFLPGYAQPASLRLPTTAVNVFLQLGDSVYQHQAALYHSRRHRVEPERYDRNAPLVAEEAPQERVRTTSSRATRQERNASRRERKRTERSKSVNVRQGDTLIEIAKKNGTTVEKLRKLNKIKGNNIRAGKKLRVK